MKVIDIHPIIQTGIYANEHYIDDRSCFSLDGNIVLFERAASGIARPQIYPGTIVC